MIDQRPGQRTATSAWPDVLAFAGGLAVAWISDWRTTDLVWSLWLSSLVVGYALIVWTGARFWIEIAGGVARDRASVRQAIAERGGRTLAAVAGLAAGGTLLVLAFMTMHFWGFHYVHSVFLAQLYPVPGMPASWGMSDLWAYREVVVRYATFLPWAFLAERAAFRRPGPERDGLSVTAEAIRARKQRNAQQATIGPYRNVVRMHLLIFFFMLAHVAGIDGFAVYAAVYAVYFFPWRLLRGRLAPAGSMVR